MFLLRRQSRNQADLLAGNTFEKNYLIIFGMRLPLMDTVHDFLKKLPSEELEKLREILLRRLMERKMFEKWKFQGLYNLSFDGTGVYTFDEEPFKDCPYKETKNGIKWYVSVLEAKLVFSNGFSISVDTEWLKNQNGRFDKQDCEQAAFKRLAAKIKAKFPRLAVMVTADGLYCSEPVFKLIKEYNWEFIFTFKDDSLKSLWEDIRLTDPATHQMVIKKIAPGQWLKEATSWINGLSYKNHTISFVEYTQFIEEGQPLRRHVHLSSLDIEKDNAKLVTRQGRMRWKLENEGFNAQKNQGFALGHKYARKNVNAMANYYLLMQIAHLISQLVEKTKLFLTALGKSGRTIKSIVEDIVATLHREIVSLRSMEKYFQAHKQLRY